MISDPSDTAPAPGQLSALDHATLRQTCLSWAVSTAKTGEVRASILSRAEAYLEFILYPLRPDVAGAIVQRGPTALQ